MPKTASGFVFSNTAFLQHQLGAPAFVRGWFEEARSLFRGLKDEHDRAWQLRFQPGQHLRRRHQHRGVRVVAAGVHHVHFLSQIRLLRFRGERKIDKLFDRKRVHVGTQRHGAPRLCAFENADDTRARDAGADLKAEAAQVISDELGGARLLIAEFRVLVNVSTPRNELRFHNRRPVRGPRLRARCCLPSTHSRPRTRPRLK